ncbi:MAG: hypothetical protein QF459_01845 [Candidatus Poseidoniia archaeon]|nr:hypothetical protein [Candidatus Poseidoniia archaeon]
MTRIATLPLALMLLTTALAAWTELNRPTPVSWMKIPARTARTSPR